MITNRNKYETVQLPDTPAHLFNRTNTIECPGANNGWNCYPYQLGCTDLYKDPGYEKQDNLDHCRNGSNQIL